MVFILYLLIITVFVYFSYNQWKSRTNLYIKSSESFTENVELLQFEINSYLNSKDKVHLHKANAYAKSIINQSLMFELYFQNQLGKQLSQNIREIFEPPFFNLNNLDEEVLKRKADEMKSILKSFSQGEAVIAYGNRYNIFPRNPYTLQKARELLETTEKIIH
jgi:hypothetical protein